MWWSRSAGSRARLTCLGPVVFAGLAALSCATPSSLRGGGSPADPSLTDGAQGTAGAAPAPASPASSSGGSPGCGKAPAHAGASAQHVNAFGRDRAYTLVVPDAYAPQTPYALVFVLHGGGGNAAAARTQTDLEKVSAGHAIFVYPDSIGGTWNLDAPTASNGDVALFDAILLVAHNTLCIDERRIFVTGFSNGAYMANQLGCKRGERIRAVATHAGGGPYETSGSYDATGNLVCPGKAVASLVVHGNSDGTVPPAEGQKSIDHWSHANRCGAGAPSSALSPPCVTLPGCFQAVDVCRIPGLGHGLWSQAGKVTWAFFDAFK